MKKRSLIRLAGLLSVLLLVLVLFAGCAAGGVNSNLVSVKVGANGETEYVETTEASTAESGEAASTEASDTSAATEAAEATTEAAETTEATAEATEADDGTLKLVDERNLSTEVKLGVFDYVKWPFSYVLSWLTGVTGNYGLALILFAILVKLLLFPASAKSKKGMMKMSRLTPKVKALEKKYADDRQKYQEEVNKLYKAEGAGGCGGCIWSLLPLLLLTPLYSIIREPITWLMFHGNISAAELAKLQNTFLTAAQQPDAAPALKALFDNGSLTGAYWQVSAMPFIQPLLGELRAVGGDSITVIATRFLGVELATIPRPLFWQYFDVNGVWNSIGQFLLPLVSGGVNWAAMWIGQKMNNTVIVDEKGEQDKEMAKSSNQSNKMMSYMMPLFSVYIGFVAPAGLSLYWVSQGVLGVVQDYFLTKHYKKIYDEEDRIKQEQAAREAALEAERERVRAEKRAQNPDGITENTSKKKLQQMQKQEQAEKEAAWQAAQKAAGETSDAPKSGDASRPYSRGRAYRRDRFEETETKNEE